MELTRTITAHFDGAAKDNQTEGKRLGTWGVFFKIIGKGVKTHELVGEPIPNGTNNQMELTACLNALRIIRDDCSKQKLAAEGKYTINHVSCLYGDSKYVIEGINEWSKKWLKNGFKRSDKKPIENVDLWKTIFNLREEIVSLGGNVQFKWIPREMNQKANELAGGKDA